MTKQLCILAFVFLGIAIDLSGQGLSRVGGLDSLGSLDRAPQGNTPTTPQQDASDLAGALATSQPPPQCVTKIKEAVKEYQQTHSDHAIRQLLDFNSNQLCTTYLLLTSRQYIAAADATKEDASSVLFQRLIQTAKSMSQQTGSSVGTGGSTNLTSKGVAAKFISLASEYGALTQSTSNLTTTAQGTLAGIPVLLLSNKIAEECSTRLLASTPCENHNVVSFLNRFSYSVSFDTSQNSQTLAGTATSQGGTSAQPATFTANTHTINSVTGKWIAIQGHQFKQADITKALTELTPDQAANVMAHTDFFQKKELSLGRSFQYWQDTAVNTLDTIMGTDADGQKTLAAWQSLGTSLVETFGIPEDMPAKQAASSDVIQNTLQLALAYETYLGQEEKLAASLVAPPVLTFEYDENRPASQPTNSVFRFISQQNLKQVTLTENGAISIYDSTPSSSIPGSSRLRDAQFAFEADHNFSINSAIIGKIGMASSGAFYFQYQSSPAILNVNPSSPVTGVTITGLPSNATQVFAKKGDIAIGQLRLTIGSGSNFKLPISVTYSNRTELVTKPTWGAQVGISYDFDSLFGK